MQDHELRRMEPPKIWDNTMRTTLVECPRKLYFFLRRFTYSSDTMPVYFIWGRAMHKGLLVWHTSPIPDLDLRQAAMIGHAEKLFRDEGGMDKPPTDTLANLRSKMQRYSDHWGPHEEEDWDFVPGGGEAGWIYPLNADWELAGSLDGYVIWRRAERGVMALENKSTSQYLSTSYRRGWHYSSQVTQYVWYLNKLLKEKQVYGAMVNMMTKKIKGPRSKWSTEEFDRELVRKMPWQLESFEEDVTADLEDFTRIWNDWRWPQRGMARLDTCSGGPGKSPCLFRGICLTPTPLAEIEASRYTGIIETDQEWKPWERQGDEDV